MLVTTGDSTGNFALVRVRAGQAREVIPGLESVSRYGCAFDAEAIYCTKPINNGTAAALVRVVRPPN